MAEQTPGFVVVDKRKFTAEGNIRDGFVAPEPASESPLVVGKSPASLTEKKIEEKTGKPEDNFSSAKLVAMPARTPEATRDATAEADDLTEEDMAGSLDATGTDGVFFDEDGFGGEAAGDDEAVSAPGLQESAAQDAAYQQSSRELDQMLAQANPGMKAPGVVNFDLVVQSFYLSAIMAMGAGTEPGQKPRIDILGARQSIDMLGVLEEKTRGNLSAQEQQLLQGITFELRMMFLELTNAISKQAVAAPAGRPGPGISR